MCFANVVRVGNDSGTPAVFEVKKGLSVLPFLATLKQYVSFRINCKY